MGGLVIRRFRLNIGINRQRRGLENGGKVKQTYGRFYPPNGEYCRDSNIQISPRRRSLVATCPR